MAFIFNQCDFPAGNYKQVDLILRNHDIHVQSNMLLAQARK